MYIESMDIGEETCKATEATSNERVWQIFRHIFNWTSSICECDVSWLYSLFVSAANGQIRIYNRKKIFNEYIGSINTEFRYD